MKLIIGIYKITSPSNRVYIGQSINIIKRWNEYKKLHCKRQHFLYNSFKKYGISNHKFEIIEQCLVYELNEKEKYYVDLFQTFNSIYGLNIKDGGGNKGSVSEATKQKISNTTKGRLGKPKTKQQKIEQSVRQKGKTVKAETKIKMSLAKIGKLKSNKTKEKMSLYSKNRTKQHLENLSNASRKRVDIIERGIKMGKLNVGKPPHNKGISKYNFILTEILENLKTKSCISISKEYGCNEAVLRNFIKHNTGHSISYYRN